MKSLLVLILLSSLVVFTFFVFPITDFDIWFHLADGKLMVDGHQFPRSDIYSYSALGNSYHPNSWGFDVLAYSLFKAVGLDGLNVGKAIISLFVFAIIIYYLYRKKILNLFSLCFVVLALFSIRDGFSLRPHTFYYLILVAFVILLFEYRQAKIYKNIAYLAVIQFVWVNFHPSFVYGLIFSGMLLVSEIYVNKKINRKDLILVGAILIASLCHLFYGYHFLVKTVSEFASPYHPPIREFLPPGKETFFSLTGLVLLSWFLVAYFSFRKKRFDILMILLAFTYLGLNSARFIRDLVLFLCLSAPLYFQKIPLPKWRIKISRTAPNILYFIMLFSLFLIAKNGPLGIGTGLQKFTYPENAVNFLKNEMLLKRTNGNLYNTYNFGGYLIWAFQPHKVFIDGRLEPYAIGENKAFDAYWSNFEGGDSWRQTVEKYGITVALMTLPHTDGVKVYNDSQKMFPSENWALVYYDDVSIIYVKRNPEINDFIRKYEYKIINPQAMDFSYFQDKIIAQKDFDGALNEVKRGLEINPDSYRLHFTASYLYNMENREELTKKELAETLEINPQFKAAQDVLTQINNGPQ